MAETNTWPPPKPGHADTLRPDSERIKASKRENAVASGILQTQMLAEGGQSNSSSDKVTHQTRSSVHRDRDAAEQSLETFCGEGAAGTTDRSSQDDNARDTSGESDWVPKPPKVLMDDPSTTPLELHSQIQLYATNECVYPLFPKIYLGTELINLTI